MRRHGGEAADERQRRQRGGTAIASISPSKAWTRPPPVPLETATTRACGPSG